MTNRSVKKNTDVFKLNPEERRRRGGGQLKLGGKCLQGREIKGEWDVGLGREGNDDEEKGNEGRESQVSRSPLRKV